MNKAYGNMEAGFALADSSDNVLEKNIANRNTGPGFDLHDSSGNTLIKNQANGNMETGFGLADSFGNSLIENKARGNGEGGFFDFLILAEAALTTPSYETCPKETSGLAILTPQQAQALLTSATITRITNAMETP